LRVQASKTARGNSRAKPLSIELKRERNRATNHRIKTNNSKVEGHPDNYFIVTT
jgi:hypothetical protein